MDSCIGTYKRWHKHLNLDSIINYKILTTGGLELLIKLPVELGLSISIISDTEVGAMYPSVTFIPSFATEGDELALYSLLPEEEIIGSDANAGGGLRDSITVKETGWFPNKFFSSPVCKMLGKNYLRSQWTEDPSRSQSTKITNQKQSPDIRSNTHFCYKDACLLPHISKHKSEM